MAPGKNLEWEKQMLSEILKNTNVYGLKEEQPEKTDKITEITS